MKFFLLLYSVYALYAAVETKDNSDNVDIFLIVRVSSLYPVKQQLLTFKLHVKSLLLRTVPQVKVVLSPNKTKKMANTGCFILKFYQFHFQDPTVIPLLMSQLSHSQRTQEYVTQIFSHCCKVFVHICIYTLYFCKHYLAQQHIANQMSAFFQTTEHQTILYNHDAIQNIAPLIISPSCKVYDIIL